MILTKELSLDSSGVVLMYSITRSTLTISFSVSVKNETNPLKSPVMESAYEMARPTKPSKSKKKKKN